MTVTAWRIVKAKHVGQLWTGEGARLFGGRWNSPGVAVIYAAESRSLAQLECLVHLESARLLDAYVLASVSFDERFMRTVSAAELPADWTSEPPSPATRAVGDSWSRSMDSVVLKVPSAVTQGEWNYLLNPQHPSFSKCKFGTETSLKFDARLR